MSDQKPHLLYLSTCDPTSATDGTSMRGGMYLRSLTEDYTVHLVHLASAHKGVPDPELVCRLGSRTTVPFSSRDYFFFSTRLLRQARDVLGRYPVTMIFADFEKSGLYAALLARRYRLPYVYSSHNVEFRRYRDVARVDWRRYPFIPWLWLAERIAVRRADLTIAISKPDAQVFQRWVDAGRVMTLPSAFDERRFHPFDASLASLRPVVLLVGNFRNSGNRDAAFVLANEILPQVMALRPDVVFRCIGQGFPEEIHHPAIENMGYVPDLVAEYRKATLVIAPIRIGGGIKIKVVEALACGKPLVATPKALEGIDHEGMELVQVGPVEQFADMIFGALQNPSKATQANWERVRAAMGARHQLGVLKQHMAQLADVATTGDAAVNPEGSQPAQ